MEPNNLDWKSIYLLQNNLSYRYYKKLSDRKKGMIDNSSLTNEQKLVAMKMKTVHPKLSFRRCIRFTKIYWLNYEDWVRHRSVNRPLLNVSVRRARKEFEHLGFVKASKFKLYSENSIYSFITTNQNFPEKLVYPERFAANYTLMVTDKLREIHFAYSQMGGVAGYTRIQYGKL